MVPFILLIHLTSDGYDGRFKHVCDLFARSLTVLSWSYWIKKLIAADFFQLSLNEFYRKVRTHPFLYRRSALARQTTGEKHNCRTRPPAQETVNVQLSMSQ